MPREDISEMADLELTTQGIDTSDDTIVDILTTDKNSSDEFDS